MCDKEKEIVIEFKDVSFREAGVHDSDVQGMNMVLGHSDLALVLVEQNHTGTIICDLAEGLLFPDAGEVRFMGKNWQDIGFSEQAEMRGLIGRVFDHRVWISNLSIVDNIVLSRRFHTLCPELELYAEAERLANEIGLSEIPAARPDVLRANELRLCEWIRAFMGSPQLLLLEGPDSGVGENHVAKLINLVKKATDGGCAVLWFTQDEELFNNRLLAPSVKYMMRGNKIIPARED